jgi:hypothetical protein
MLCASVASLLLLPGCAGGQSTAPQTTPSSSSVGYALEWPARLETISGRYRDGAAQTRADAKTLPSYPAELSELDPSFARDVYELADEAGRSHAIVEHLRSSRSVAAFVEQHEKELAWRIGGHVNAALKRSGCDCEYETGPGTMAAIKGAVDDRIDERHREINEAHRLLDRRAADANKRDVDTLRKQIDGITRASFFVYIDSIDLRLEIDRLLGELEEIRRTLDEAIAAERAVATDSEASKTQVKAAAKRLEELEAAKAPLGGAVNKAQNLREQMEEDTEQVKASYETALKQLIEGLEKQP